MVSLLAQFSQLTEEEFQGLWQRRDMALPELAIARQWRHQLERAPQTQYVLRQTRHLLESIEHIPQTSYTLYRLLHHTGDRRQYEHAYFLKRARLAACALRLFLGQRQWKDTVQNYLWSICEESNWVLPAHESQLIDLFAAETGFMLAETLLLLGDTLDEEVRQRVRAEVERRICDPYLRFHTMHEWYRKGSNWNGVCNSSIAATFVLLEQEAARLHRALEIALTGLDAYLEAGFAEDGSSNEGVSYWHYGLINFVALGEMLYSLSRGALNLFAPEKMQRIASFPAKLQLSGAFFASFADCDERVLFHPGIIMRLAERTGVSSLLHLLVRSAEPESDWRLAMMLRNVLWWDGNQPETVHITDARLPAGGVARLVAPGVRDVPVVLAIKAGHNGEEHNHNDIGSFVLHVAGENLLTDPGRGLYTRDYFTAKRYENIFANSYGHSVPRIDGRLQERGRAFAGALLEDEQTVAVAGEKRIALEFGGAYVCADLKSARREWLLQAEKDGVSIIWLHDAFEFVAGAPHIVEEAFVTWLECEVAGAIAHIHGLQYEAHLTIEEPQGALFQLELLEEQSKANQKPGVLKRLSIPVLAGESVEVRICITVNKRTS